MEAPTFTNLAIVAAVAFGVPLLLGLVPRLPIPSLVIELVAGIVLGPQGLGWVELDSAVQVMALARHPRDACFQLRAMSWWNVRRCWMRCAAAGSIA